ncbi:MAG: DUF4034 domain-containing protein [Cellvibrionaceae bacterium]|nr:DUF4034 domain-containing protein [Cellvibrionaceae bacterium]
MMRVKIFIDSARLLLILALVLPGAVIAKAVDTDLFAMRSMLQTHHFDSLQTRLAAYNERYLTGHSSDHYRDYHWSVETLWKDSDLDQPWLEAALSRWLQQYPQSAYGRAVLGKFYTDKGFAARGGKWASETQASQFDAMEEWFKRAMDNLQAALDSQDDILFAHIQRLNIIKASRHFHDETLISYMDKVPAKVKQKPGVWIALLQSLTPRWGGSYALMHSVIAEVVPAELTALPATAQYFEDAINYDKIKVMLYKKDYKDALKLAEKSIAVKTPYPDIYAQAANAAQQLNKYAKCYRYGKIATAMRPQRAEGWTRFGFCASKLKKWREVNSAYSYKIHISGLKKYALYRLGESYMHLHQYAKAYPLFKQAEALDSDYRQYTQRFTQYIETEKPEAMALEGENIYQIIGPVFYKKRTGK